MSSTRAPGMTAAQEFCRRANVKMRMFVLVLLGLSRRRTQVERLGSPYGGWIIPKSVLDSGSLVVSVGVGEDTTFDEEVARIYGCRVVGVDPTPRAAEHVKRVAQQLGHRFLLMDVALSGADGDRTFYPPQVQSHVSYSLVHRNRSSEVLSVRTVRLATLLRMLGDVGSSVQLLKLDIEGAEGEVIKDIVRHGPSPQVVCVEFDRRGIRHLIWNFMRLTAGGYRLVAAEGLNATFIRVREPRG